MTTTIQKAILLDSQNQVSNADRLAREWAIAHAGDYQGQARRELGGSGAFRQWQQDNMTIRISKPISSAIEQGQLVSVHYEYAEGAEPYVAYVITYTSAASDQPGGCLMSVAAVPDGLENAELPWDDKAGPTGLEKVVETVAADRAHPADVADAIQPIAAIDGLFVQHDMVIVLTEDGQQVDELRELADRHGDWAGLASISAAELVSIGRQLTMEELYSLVQAKIALFSKYTDGAGRRLIMAESDYEIASAFLNDAREHARYEIMNRNVFMLMELLESIANAQDAQESDIAMGSPAETAAVEDDEQDLVSAQQRIYTLEDQLSEAGQTISALREQLAQYEAHYSEEQADDPDDTPDNGVPADLDVNRALTVLNAIGDEKRFPRLRFLINSVKLLEDYGKPRPNGVEILQALDAINLLAAAWHNTPSGNIGSWGTYFINLPGWKYAADESETTMGLHGTKRSFSDQEVGRLITITRHLTYQGSSGDLQIYFDLDDATDKFIVGYIGEHLPYATNRS